MLQLSTGMDEPSENVHQNKQKAPASSIGLKSKYNSLNSARIHSNGCDLCKVEDLEKNLDEIPN